MRKVIKAGFLGAGDIADLHAAGVNSCPQAQLAGIFDIDAQKAERKATQYGCRSFCSYEEMLADPEVDAVFVLTPLEEHHDGVVRALEAGKHVLVEKPAAVNIEQIKDMQRVAAAAGKVCMPVHNYLYEDSVTRTRE
ncbi:MAG: Gfo/Idh/MocA family oxidoreductase, partial [Verrucomicrobiaceae bacterium]|nr:Gfo/Idh/MocA family oxidoreductase [Verrucomicrobiaceae bacterium]